MIRLTTEVNYKQLKQRFKFKVLTGIKKLFNLSKTHNYFLILIYQSG